MKTIYLVRHSAPFVEIDNYEDFKSVSWNEYNRNMILSSEGEEKAKKLCDIEEFKDIYAIYSADSFRAIGTAKYVAEMNDLKIRLDKRINERNLGVNTISELPENFSKDSFDNKELKYKNGESLNEVDNRFNSFINEVLESNKSNIALFIHGIIMMSYLQNNTDFSFDGRSMKLIFNERIVYDDKMKNPLVIKLLFDDNKNLINIEYIEE
jgi:broad specificity phosphatase PhoE